MVTYKDTVCSVVLVEQWFTIRRPQHLQLVLVNSIDHMLFFQQGGNVRSLANKMDELEVRARMQREYIVQYHVFHGNGATRADTGLKH